MTNCLSRNQRRKRVEKNLILMEVSIRFFYFIYGVVTGRGSEPSERSNSIPARRASITAVLTAEASPVKIIITVQFLLIS